MLPPLAVTKGISRFALTVSIGMAFGPFVGIQIQNRMSSWAAFLTVFAMTVAALILLAFVRIAYPKKKAPTVFAAANASPAVVSVYV